LGCKDKGIRKLEFVTTTQIIFTFFRETDENEISKICFRIFRERTECEKYETFVKGNYLRKNAKISQKPWVLHK